jgi:hypothetical protein
MPHSLSRYVNAIVTYIIFIFIKVNRILTGMCITTKAQSSFTLRLLRSQIRIPLRGIDVQWYTLSSFAHFRFSAYGRADRKQLLLWNLFVGVKRLWSCRWGKTVALNCGYQRAYCSSPTWYMGVESNGGMILTGETGQFGEKPVPVPLYPPQIPYGLTRARTRTYALRGRRLTAWAMARPYWLVS